MFEMLTPPERPTIQTLEMHMPPIDSNGIFVMMQTAPTTDCCNYEMADPVNKLKLLDLHLSNCWTIVPQSTN